jgi:ATP-dependent Clp protease ATP-binding subunit ClpA
VVLLDEVEKAHTDVMELFFQVFDKGMMEDGEGRRIDFKNCLIILTSNLGTDLIMNLCADEETMPDAGRHERDGQAGIAQALQTRFLGPHEDRTLLPHHR